MAAHNDSTEQDYTNDMDNTSAKSPRTSSKGADERHLAEIPVDLPHYPTGRKSYPRTTNNKGNPTRAYFNN